jgi:hypothetical protein
MDTLSRLLPVSFWPSKPAPTLSARKHPLVLRGNHAATRSRRALLLLLFTILSGTISALSLLPSAQWWHAIGGVASAFYLVSGILLFPQVLSSPWDSSSADKS